MTTTRLIVGMQVAILASAASAAAAGPTVPLGTPVGVGLGSLLGGHVLGQALPLVGGGMVVLAAACLALGIYIVRRKQKN